MKEKEQKLPLLLAFLPMLVVIILGLLSVTKWKAGMNIPIIAGIVTAGFIGVTRGKKWKDLQNSLVQGVSRVLPALFIVLVIGLIIGAWIQGGIIPSLIYYSLKLISPSIFVPISCVVTAIIAVATGTSFTSIATVGLALMATGIGMGFPAPLLAGAIISGAYFGDSISPLSDTTNLASAVSECSLFELVGHLAKSGIPAMLLSLVGFFFLGLRHSASGSLDLSSISGVLTGLSDNFVITPLLLLIPVITILFSVFKLPALPSLLMVAFLGGVCALAVQGFSVGEVLRTMVNGFVCETGNGMIDKLLTRGGINSMGETVILLTIATAFGGILEEIGALDSILSVVMKRVKSVGTLVLFTIISGLCVAFATGAQLLSVVIPGRMFGNAYKEWNLAPKNLGRVVQSIGTICINLVPWSVPALFAQNILGVDAIEFIPYILFAFATIIINIIYGYTGFTMDKRDQTETAPLPENA